MMGPANAKNPTISRIMTTTARNTTILRMLFAIALRPYRVAFWLMALFALCMQVGSVFLGWHYAIDGYAGGILAALCYYGIAPLFSDRKAVVVAAAPADDRPVTPAS